jgi:hypothetical protein
MKNKMFLAILFAGLLISGTPELSGQVKYGGYLAAEYLKGQPESEFALGSIQNLQAGFLAAGVVSSKWAFALEVRARSESLSQNEQSVVFSVEQAWVGFVPSAAVNIRAGLYLVPFGIWNRANRPHEALLIGTPLNLEFLYPVSWRDLGILAEGKIGILTYAAYIGNGLKETASLEQGQQFSDNNKDKGKGGRLGLEFGRGIQVGASYYTGKYDDLNERRLTLEGADLSWVTDQWEVKAEATRGILENPEPFAEGKTEGYSVWTVMKFATLQPVGSFQRVKSDDLFHGEGTAFEKTRWTAGFRYVLHTNIYLKAEYQWNNETPKIKNNLVLVQVALAF